MSSILTVSQLNRYMSFKIKEDTKLRGLLVKGEISGFTHHMRTGHFYFTLKDSTSSIKAVMFSSYAASLKFMPQSGMNVIVMGSLQVFERDGVYQLYVTDIQPDGIGAQYLAFEQLKEKLAAEGLFEPVYKKPLPKFPKRVGIVTAKGGAALRDILNIIGRRYPFCEAIVFPCVVQGEYAVDSICEALEFADSSGCDVIICGRGGGSPEDLFAFNSEKIARTVFAMNTPVISAVGHETDTTLIDFVSDLRAPTPSAAAELAVPDTASLLAAVDSYKNALDNAFATVIARKRHELMAIESELKNYAPSAALSAMREKLASNEIRLSEAMKSCIEKKKAVIGSRAAALDSLSPLKIMSRGYSLVYKENELIKSADELSEGDRITVKFADNEASAVIVK
ncbi:MAG: exodeoxyribonuclease VII large subunit [Oscillospiraceae bacterium]|nr:exodeoxyribonuclease VII large subunit [Oscillospiraceae bacterium]MDY2862982.1 exodeoxyribonuclease VII large subunit [Oscillospiraceae bacterium]